MAISQTHFRSISLPSRLHPINPTNFETELQKLNSLQISAANSEAIQSGLLRIAELYNSVQEITQSQQKSVVVEHHQHENSMEESLSGSVELLDACSAIREVFQMMKENIQVLQSSLRRKGMDSSVQNDITTYFCCRKRMNKSISKILKNLKKSEQSMMKNGSNLSAKADSSFTTVFRELTGITISIFKSVVVFLTLPMARHGGWSLVSKLMIAKSGRENDDVNEVGNVDLALSSLQKMRGINGATTVVDVQKRLQNVEAIIEGFEGGLERLFRQFVQIRVTLLNILTDHDH